MTPKDAREQGRRRALAGLSDRLGDDELFDFSDTGLYEFQLGYAEGLAEREAQEQAA